jgi:hypothetical protein
MDMKKYIFTAVIFLLFFASDSAHAAVEISDGSVQALYHLEDASDSSRNSYNLTNINASSFSPGKFSNAADTGSSNTNKYFSVSSSLGISRTGIYSLSFWVNTYEIPAFGIQKMLVTGRDSATNGAFAIYLEGNSSCPNLKGLTFSIGAGGGVTYYCHDWNPGEWHHIIVTADGFSQSMKAYVDGVLRVSTTGIRIPEVPAVTDNQFQIFTFRSGVSPTSALIDELIVTNNIMSTSTREALWNDGVGNEVSVPAKYRIADWGVWVIIIVTLGLGGYIYDLLRKKDEREGGARATQESPKSEA